MMGQPVRAGLLWSVPRQECQTHLREGENMSTELCRVYRPNEFHRDAVMHRSNHDPLWLHNFGQPGYVTPIDYGQHVARELALQAAYVASGAAEKAAERYAVALAGLRKPRPQKAAETFV
jgi:hypothetical protein